MKFILNDKDKIYNGDEDVSLLTYLRDKENITSPKDGCSPQAACGACVVEMNGRAVLSCVTPMKKVDGKKVTTIEGLSQYQQKVFANAFVAKGGVQCGFCIPGIV
ncbi:2Fe-2S iron-sulfur cluster binding domain-containing protein, partial [Candidatus Saccharibacteria bacterium]|nr:2Fe-2S iron-sulfur cluster binding domain-containing protein [Calditrichia bacterium]NIV73143.1 2Fe-2S iron-sulfur cluster binding domain-containing protein [Calditrichia bacterium]NIW00075.1 2Fe-2S iron-sulfur cluster binding domain-containing protein [Candidatus Saccharibacteria bacterium]